MKTKKRIPFDIKKVHEGAKVVTKNGFNVTIRAFLDDKSYTFPIEAVVKDPTGKIKSKDTLYYTNEGRLLSVGECDLDLLIEEETDDYNPYKATVEAISEMTEMVDRHLDSDLKNFFDTVKVRCKEAIEYEKKWLKKQDEQETSEELKIIPDKWYVCTLGWENDGWNGDWKFIEGHTYLGEEILQNYPMDENEIQDHVRLWTIKDAKPGDILASKDGSDILIFKNFDDTESFSSYYNESERENSSWDNSCFVPATKHQCDLLYQKLKKKVINGIL